MDLNLCNSWDWTSTPGGVAEGVDVRSDRDDFLVVLWGVRVIKDASRVLTSNGAKQYICNALGNLSPWLRFWTHSREILALLISTRGESPRASATTTRITATQGLEILSRSRLACSAAHSACLASQAFGMF